MPYHAVAANVNRLYNAVWAPWMQGGVTAPMTAPGYAPTAGACGTIMGPVANICQSTVPVTHMVPVTTVTPVPSSVRPRTYVGTPGAQAPQYGAYGKGMAPGYGQFGKGMAPGMPGLYTTEAAIIGW